TRRAASPRAGGQSRARGGPGRRDGARARRPRSGRLRSASPQGPARPGPARARAPQAGCGAARSAAVASACLHDPFNPNRARRVRLVGPEPPFVNVGSVLTHRQRRCLVILPTFNERANLAGVVAGIRGAGHDALVVDDTSPDGTGAIAAVLAEAAPGA